MLTWCNSAVTSTTIPDRSKWKTNHAYFTVPYSGVTSPDFQNFLPLLKPTFESQAKWSCQWWERLYTLGLVHTARDETDSKSKTWVIFSDAGKCKWQQPFINSRTKFKYFSLSLFKHHQLAFLIKLSKNPFSLLFDTVESWLMKCYF